MEFRILGPLEAGDGRTLLPLGPRKQRAVLAFLLLNANHAVSVERLVDELWGDEPPASAVKAIQSYVSRLRKVLPDGTLRTRPAGYVVEIQPEELDLRVFERELSEGNRALAEGKVAVASASLRRALGRWRGSALTEFVSEPFAVSEGPRLEEVRLFALEGRIDADLALGHHADLVSELESLVSQHPLRERFVGQLMLALYRSGRHAEALAAYREARRLLVEELGIEPSRSLHELERAILRQDSSLDLPSLARAGNEAAPVDEARDLASSSTGGRLGGFVGRLEELERLRNSLECALTGNGRLVMLSGEPGIGKTRIAVELAAHAESRGVRVLWGRCYEREGAPPYWPWVQAIRAYIDTCDPEVLRSALRGQTAAAELVPQIAELLPDLEPAVAPVDANEARFRLLDSLATFLKRASQTHPLMVVLDDLHAGDAGSLLLLEFVARELADSHLLVIGTYRDEELPQGHPLPETLAELRRDRLVERLPLRGLTEADVARFIKESIGLVPPRDLVRAVYRQADGNPLFMTEVVRLLLEEGGLTPERMRSHEGWSVRIPEGIRQVIGRRLKRLSEHCRGVLTIGSVIGREFGFHLLHELTDEISEERVLELLDEAVAARIIDELPGAVGRYQFTHTLIQETLADELSRTGRARLHARVAQAFEELYGFEAEAHAAELAHHFGEAEVLLGPEKLIRYSLLAGEAALATHAYEQALTHFERAHAAKDGRPVDDEAAAILFGLGRAQLATLEGHERERGLATMDRAFDYYVAVGDLERAVAVATHPPPSFIGVLAKSQMPARALGLVPHDSHEAGLLLGAYGWFAGVGEADYDTATGAFEGALSLARTYGDLSLETRTLARAAYVDSFHVRWPECREKALRAVELAVRSDDLQSEAIARTTAARVFTVTAEPVQAALQAAAGLARAEKLRDRWWLSTARFNAELLSAFRGEWRAARDLLGPALDAQPRDPRHVGLHAWVECELGNFEEAAAYAERLLEGIRSFPPPGPTAEYSVAAGYLALIGRIAGRHDFLVTAKEAAEAVLSTPRIVPSLTTLARAGAALVATQLKDSVVARALYATLEEQTGVAIPLTPLTADRVLALLAMTSGRLDAAIAHFEDALAFCERGGYNPEYAWTAHEYAATLRKRSDTGDKQRAAALNERALAIAHTFNLAPLAEALELVSEQAAET